MITAEDLIHISYTSDLSLGAVAYACRSLNFTYDRMGGSTYDRLRRIAAGVAVELAFRRHLTEHEVPYDVFGATPFTEPDRYDVAIAGRRCDLKSYLIYRRSKIRSIQRGRTHLIDAPALVPADQMASSNLQDGELLVFGFLLGLIAPEGKSLARAQKAGQPDFLVHTLPQPWGRPTGWTSLGSLALKMDASQPLWVELGGLDRDREFVTERLELQPRQRRTAENDFYALTYLHVSHLPDGRVGVHSPALRDTYLAHADTWQNIWIYGLEIVLAGFLTVREFRRRARRLPPGSRVLQYPTTRTENRAVPLAQLRPLLGLYSRIK